MFKEMKRQFPEGFRDAVSQHIAKRLPEIATDQLRADLANAANGIPRDENQRKRWERLGLL